MQATNPPAESQNARRAPYALVFVLLAVITAVEVGLSYLGLPRTSLTAPFLMLSLGKASLVAAFFMHLRSDTRFYTYLLVIPALMLLLFALLTAASS